MIQIQRLHRNPALPWVLVFLLFCIANPQTGGTNAISRIAGLRAITEGHTLNIDNYRDWSEDWSKAPNGHYYPNKAPGGVLFGLPFFYAVDSVYNAIVKPGINGRGQHPHPRAVELTVFSLLTQFLPFALLVLYAAEVFGKEMGFAGTSFFVVAALFGNTAAIYMTTYFGHGLSSLLMFACFLAWLKRRYGISGALIAAAFLTEYGTGFVIPFFLIATALRERSWRPLLRITLAALPFAALWVWYHQTAFGSPFNPAIRFSNPAMIEDLDKDGAPGLWGMMGILPSPLRIYKLLFGPERGLLFTQPWMLAVFPFFFARTRLPRGTQCFLCGGFAALLWMNASIGGWDGGWCLGPRYLCQLFPAIALALGLAWPQLSRPWRALLKIGLAVAVAFRILVLPFPVLAPPVDLWYLYSLVYWRVPLTSVPYLFLAFAVGCLAAAATWAFLQEKKR